ncbi:MAG TPA: hypothetical protein DDZ99_05290 [Clostridiales bacterium]|nr:hypothetical protein [Clostridiales bacterium]
MLYSNVGSGKSNLAIVTGIAACNNDKRVRFFRTASLVNEFVEAKKQGYIVKFMKNLEKCDFLICDEKITAAIIDRIIYHNHLLDFSSRDSRCLMNSLIKLT